VVEVEPGVEVVVVACLAAGAVGGCRAAEGPSGVEGCAAVAAPAEGAGAVVAAGAVDVADVLEVDDVAAALGVDIFAFVTLVGMPCPCWAAPRTATCRVLEVDDSAFRTVTLTQIAPATMARAAIARRTVGIRRRMRPVVTSPSGVSRSGYHETGGR
jgi:hypothetical protein